MGCRHLCPFRIGPSLTRTIKLLELLDVDQLDRRRVLIVLERRLVPIVPLADAQEARLAVTADHNGTARTKVDGAGAVHDDIHLRRTRHEEIRRRQTQTDTVLTPVLRQFLIEIPVSEAHIRQQAIRVGLDVRSYVVGIEELLLERLNGKVQRHRAGVDRRLNHALNVKGHPKDRFLEAPRHDILSEAIVIKEELIFLNADIGADLRILGNKTAQTFLLFM